MSAEASAFSTADESAITRIIDVLPDATADQLSTEEFDRYYEIQQTSVEIIQGDYKRIALQFPDELLHHSVPIYKRLKSKIGLERDLYVLADTSYGSCCVDEVAAQHVNADAIVHYGYACLSLTSRLPVIYVFGHKPLDIERCVSEFLELYISRTSDFPSQVALFRHEVAYTHIAETLLAALRQAFEPLRVTIRYSKSGISSAPSDNSASSTIVDHDLIFYIGGESLSLTNLLMTNASHDVFSFDPISNTGRLESSRTNKMLMRRYAVVQKARDADVFGILVGTLGVASYLSLITYLRKLLSSRHKKTYTISVGKLTPSKLANFLEIECFVIVACPENSLIEAKEFFKPIITPYELEVALKQDVKWTGKYVLDFGRVIAEGDTKDGGEQGKNDENNASEESEGQDSDQPEFSLISGKYRHAKRYGVNHGSAQLDSKLTSDSLVLRNQDNEVSMVDDNAAAQFFQQRAYRGLEVHLGEDAPSILEQGRSGIARGYQTDYGVNGNE